MIVIAGGIGSGKSIVSRILRLKGFGVYDCDLRARVLMEKDSRLRQSIEILAGKDIYKDYELDRKELAKRMFSDDRLRYGINKIVHEAVRNNIKNWCKKSEDNIFVETAIPSESGLAEMADEIWVVEADVETRLNRVATRDHRDVEEILKIINIQRCEEKSLFKSGIKIVKINNNDFDALLPCINSLIESSDLYYPLKIKN